MSNERIDLQWLLEEDGLMQDLNWSIARFEQVEKLVKEMTAELKKCYEEIDTFHPLHGLEVWDEDPDYSRAEWREEVAEGHVTSGYWRWVSNQYLASE
jgi:hypothetical protein|tara:strand:+ start:438 stop:731 length:294 start_codon:yes stop_codon:yes gene_type:complete